MSQRPTQSRLDSNREIRRVLVKNGVDTTRVQFSCHGRYISLTGSITGDNGHDIAISSIEAIFNELNRLGYQYNCDFDNWIISEGTISKKGAKIKEVPVHPGPSDKKINKTAA